jgi:hypothetical protein
MLESLFFRCYWAYLRGQFQECSVLYEILKEEFKHTGHKDSLSDSQLTELKKIREALKTGKKSVSAG